MPIPEFNEIKAPALEFFSDGQPHKTSEIFRVLGQRLKLTEQDLGQLLPSGTQSRWHNRANWACYDLYRAGLLVRPKKGVYVISELGKQIAAEKPAKIDREYLMRFPQFVEFIKKSAKGAAAASADPVEKGIIDPIQAKATPEERKR